MKKQYKTQQDLKSTSFIFKPAKNIEQNYFKNWRNPKYVARIWAIEFKKELMKKEQKPVPKKMKGPEATMGQLLASVSKDVTKIANSVAWFFSGGGFGIGLAVGLTPPLLVLGATIVGAIWILSNTITKLVSPLIQPINSILTSIGNLTKRISNISSKILSIFDSPISTLSKGVKGVVSNVKEKFTNKNNNNIVKKSDDLNIIYNNFKATFIRPLFTRFDKFQEKAYNFFDKSNEKMFLEQSELVKQRNYEKSLDILEKTGSNIKNGIKEGYNDVKNMFSNIMNNISGNKPIEIKNDSFSQLTQSFNSMRNDSIQVLNEIKNAVIEISQHKIEIGNNLTKKTGIAMPNDTKLNPINVMVNNKNDNSEIISILKSMNNGVTKIANNTAISDKPIARNTSNLWSLEG